MKNTSLRTQIILPKTLREQIEKVRVKTGESMAEYLRKAAEERLLRESKQLANLRDVANQVVGCIKQSSWNNVDIIKWQQQMRKDKN